MKKVILTNLENGSEKEVKVGYSFATLFLNFLVPLSRKDLLGTLMILAYDLVAYVFFRDLGQVVATAIGFILLPVVYDRFYIAGLEAKGYVEKENVLEANNEIHFAA